MKPEIKTRLAQIQAGEIPQGYKNTPIGILKSDWSNAKLYEIAEILTETAGKNQYETLSISAGIGFVNQAKKFGKELSGKQYEKYIVLRKGDFSYNKGNSKSYPQGCIYRLNDREEAAVPNVFESFRIAKGCPEYYEQLFIAGFLNSQLYRFINHGVRDDGLLNLTEKDFYSCIVPVPPLEEQQRIASILSAQDKVIELCERKIEQLKRMKKYYLQNMFPKDGEEYPEIRFKGFTEPWEQRKLGEVLEISTHKNGDRYTKEDVLSVSDDFGCVNQIRFQGRSFAGADISNYKIVSTGDIVYTRSPLQAKPFGIIKIVRDEIGVVSPLYIVNKAINGNDAEFIYRVFDLPYKTNNYLSPLVRKGAKNTMNISEDEWLSGDIIVSPIYEEQQTIGAFFKDLDHLITLHQRKCEEEKKKKKALQQLLLTGIVRV